MITLELSEAPSEIEAGTDFTIRLTVSGPQDCDLRGAPFRIRESDQTVLDGELPELTGEHLNTAEIALTAPERVGQFDWTFVLPARDSGGQRYEEVSLPFSFMTKPHATSLAVWGAPSPVVVDEPFGVKVGATCTAGCALSGTQVEIRNAAGVVIAAGTLGDAPFPGSDALYWASVELRAPIDEGPFFWTVNFSPEDVKLPHGSASASLNFLTIRKPEHDVSVRVVVKDTQLPLADVQVRLGPHRASTDDTGTARLAVPTGEHSLSIWKVGYDAPDRTMRVISSAEVQIEVAALPDEDPFAFWRG